jgi:nitrite reductase (NO-forming)
MLEAHPNFVVFNGQLNKSGAEHPISIKVGRLVRVFFVNAGPNLASTFHVAGVMFSTVYHGGNPANLLHGIDNLVVGPSAGAVFEFKVSEPGNYRFMDLDRAHEYNGAMGVFRAEP